MVLLVPNNPAPAPAPTPPTEISSSSVLEAREVLLLLALFLNLFAARRTPAALRKILRPLNASCSSCSVGSAIGSLTFSSYESNGSEEDEVSQGSDQRELIVERFAGDFERSEWSRVCREGERDVGISGLYAQVQHRSDTTDS